MQNKTIFQKTLHFNLSYYWLPILITIALFLFSLLGYAGKVSWFCDLFTHFKVQYFLISMFCGIILLLFAFITNKSESKTDEADMANAMPQSRVLLTKKQLFIFAAFSFLVALINLIEIAPLYNSVFSKYLNQKQLRLMHINVHTANTRYNDVQQYILEQDPDILLLEEVSEEWIKKLPEIIKKYPYSTIYPQSDNFGIAMFAKIKPIESKALLFGEYGAPYIKSIFTVGDEKITLFGIHTIPPIGKIRFQERNRMLNYIAEMINKLENSSVILIGDLNISPWSYFFKKLLHDANLRNSQCGFGIQPSWPTSPFPLLIPIDHCLVSKDIIVNNRFIGKDVGSDHYPVVIDIQLP
jgi:endonuclease/exonuclease/phosphatase (EEP) superfamily protein YafD